MSIDRRTFVAGGLLAALSARRLLAEPAAPGLVRAGGRPAPPPRAPLAGLRRWTAAFGGA